MVLTVRFYQWFLFLFKSTSGIFFKYFYRTWFQKSLKLPFRKRLFFQVRTQFNSLWFQTVFFKFCVEAFFRKVHFYSFHTFSNFLFTLRFLVRMPKKKSFLYSREMRAEFRFLKEPPPFFILHIVDLKFSLEIYNSVFQDNYMSFLNLFIL